MTVADFGSGSGHYVLETARRIGNTGTVYAVDIQKNLLEKIKTEAGKNNLTNVEIVWADLEGPEGSRLASGAVDFLVISNILFQLRDKIGLAREASRVLKSGGRAAVIDWSESGTGGLGPAPSAVVAQKEAERIFTQEGFTEEREFPAGSNHYGLIFRKQ